MLDLVDPDVIDPDRRAARRIFHVFYRGRNGGMAGQVSPFKDDPRSLFCWG